MIFFAMSGSLLKVSANAPSVTLPTLLYRVQAPVWPSDLDGVPVGLIDRFKAPVGLSDRNDVPVGLIDRFKAPVGPFGFGPPAARAGLRRKA